MAPRRLGSCRHGWDFSGGDVVFKRLRREVLESADLLERAPDFLRRNRDLGQFWQFIKHKFASYAERRQFLWDAFAPLIDFMETPERMPAVTPITEAFKAFNASEVQRAWQKALDRRTQDPEGAITAARTLLESVCKHILDDAGVAYAGDVDLPKLWALCAERLSLLPSQHEEIVFKAILGNCQAVVGSLAAMRNKVGDAHGSGRRKVKPLPRHAELAVNLAGAMAAFLVSTWHARSGLE